MNMYGDERITEEISAHLDGRADDPIALDEAMRRDPSLARRFEQMQTVSKRLRGLPDPEVHPAFVTRVMARVAETRPAPRAPWWRWAAVCSAAALFIFVAALSAMQNAKTAGNDPIGNNIAALEPAAGPDLFEDAVRNIAEPGDFAFNEIVAGADDVSQLDSIEQASVFASVEREVESNLELETVLMTLTDDEIVQLRQLLKGSETEKGSWS